MPQSGKRAEHFYSSYGNSLSLSTAQEAVVDVLKRQWERKRMQFEDRTREPLLKLLFITPSISIHNRSHKLRSDLTGGSNGWIEMSWIPYRLPLMMTSSELDYNGFSPGLIIGCCSSCPCHCCPFCRCRWWRWRLLCSQKRTSPQGKVLTFFSGSKETIVKL